MATLACKNYVATLPDGRVRFPRYFWLAARGLVMVGAPGASHAQTTGASELQTLPTVVVRASADASAAGLTPPYAGGQVARGARLGVLGGEDMMNAPFSVMSYTNELIQDRQSRSVSDVLLQDPAVRVARGFGNFQESYFIRGFVLSSDNVAYNGLYGLLPRQYIAAQLFDRVEVLRGASAFLNGASPGGDAIGGSINLVPKRAPEERLTELTLGGADGAQRYLAVDVARRFNAQRDTGLRLAASRREGGTGIDSERADTSAFMLGFDWRSRDIRISADIGFQDNRLSRTRTNVTLAATAASVPVAPGAASNWAQPWSYSNEKDAFGAVRAEFDVSPTVTAWLAAGFRRSQEANSLANLTVTKAATGAATTSRFDNSRRDAVDTGEIGLRLKLKTGPVNHQMALAATIFEIEKRNAFGRSERGGLATNLFNPVDLARPAFTVLGNDLGDPKTTSSIQLASVVVSDTASIWDDRMMLTFGVRHQEFNIRSYGYNTGLEGTPYLDHRNSPSIALLVKASNEASFYANVVQSLAVGDTAPSIAANAGAELAPYVSKQRELGLKFDTGQVGGSLACFVTTRPRAAIDADNVYRVLGEDKHQGLELQLFGMPTPTLRLHGGVALLDARQRATGNSTTDGKRVIGVPNAQGNMDIEVDVPRVHGLSANLRLIETGRVYADAANTLAVPGWTRLDLGARYAVRLDGHDIALRARVDNVLGRRYWASSGGFPGAGYLVLGSPRTYTTSATFSF